MCLLILNLTKFIRQWQTWITSPKLDFIHTVTHSLLAFSFNLVYNCIFLSRIFCFLLILIACIYCFVFMIDWEKQRINVSLNDSGVKRMIVWVWWSEYDSVRGCVDRGGNTITEWQIILKSFCCERRNYRKLLYDQQKILTKIIVLNRIWFNIMT